MKKMQKIQGIVLFSLFLALCCNPNEAMITSPTMPTKTIRQRFLEFLEAEETFALASDMFATNKPDCLIGNKLTNDKVSTFLECMEATPNKILVEDESLFKEYFHRNIPRVYPERLCITEAEILAEKYSDFANDFYDPKNADINIKNFYKPKSGNYNDFYKLPTKNVLLSIKHDENNEPFIDFPGEFILFYGSLNTHSCPTSPVKQQEESAFAEIGVSVTIKTKSGFSYKIPYLPVFALFKHRVFFSYGSIRVVFQPEFLQICSQKIPIPKEKRSQFANLNNAYFTVETTVKAEPFFETTVEAKPFFEIKATAKPFFETTAQPYFKTTVEAKPYFKTTAQLNKAYSTVKTTVEAKTYFKTTVEAKPYFETTAQLNKAYSTVKTTAKPYSTATVEAKPYSTATVEAEPVVYNEQ